MVQSVEGGNGFESWGILCYRMLPKSATAGYTALMNPTFATRDPRLNLQKWDQDALRYEEAFGEKVTDTMRRSIYQNVIAPVEVQQHLLLNSAKYECAEDIRNAMEEFCEAREEAEATKTGTPKQACL